MFSNWFLRIDGSAEYSGAVYTTCPVIGNHHSGLVETDVPELETA